MADDAVAASGRILRVAAYGVCQVDERLLLARYVSPDGSRRHWALPGGRVEHAEDPYDAVVREVEEETGYRVRVERLLGVDARTRHVSWARPDGASMHNIGVFYRVSVVGGELRHEANGSTDLAAWIPTDELRTQERSVVIDVGLALADSEPPDGHVDPIPVEGFVRH
jgi:8-oxo-dGTP diphosphatase